MNGQKNPSGRQREVNAQNSPETTAKLPKEKKEKMGGMRTMM